MQLLNLFQMPPELFRQFRRNERNNNVRKVYREPKGFKSRPYRGPSRDPSRKLSRGFLGRDKVQNHEIATHNLASREVHRCTFSEFCYIPRDLRLTTQEFLFSDKTSTNFIFSYPQLPIISVKINTSVLAILGLFFELQFFEPKIFFNILNLYCSNLK